MKDKKELNALKEENRRLREELERAKKKLLLLDKEKRSETPEFVSGKAERYINSKHYLGFLLRSFKASNIYARLKTVMAILSKFRIVSLLVKIITAVVVFLETSAHFLLFSTVALITLPITVIFGLITFMVAFLYSNKANKSLRHLPDNKSVYVFFPRSVKRLKENNFFRGWVNEISSDENNLVIIVSPAFWKRAGFVKGKYYLHYRREADNVFMIRNYYFFSFRRNVLSKADTSTVYMIH